MSEQSALTKSYRPEIRFVDIDAYGIVHNATYLANLPPTYRRPRKGCHPNDMKEFVKEVYIELRFHDPNGTPSGQPAVASPGSANGGSPSPPKMKSGYSWLTISLWH